MNTTVQQEALKRATTNHSKANYDTIIQGFIEMGIGEEDILPRENIFTFQAWLAKGRVVKKGERGVRILTFVPMSKELESGEVKNFRRPKTTVVFHISQTEPIKNEIS